MPSQNDLRNQQPGQYLEHIILKQSGISQGTRLTSKQIGLLKMGDELQEAEREMLLEILFV